MVEESVEGGGLSVEQDLILRNVERMLESVLDQLDVVSSQLSGPAQQGVVASASVGAAVLQCPNCLQLNTMAQLRDGRCFVCGAPLVSSGV